MKSSTGLFTSYVIDSGKPGSHVLITAGVHGDEYEPMIAAMRLRDFAGRLITRGKITIVPVVNETAYRAGKRCGEDGMDLARTCPGNLHGTTTEQVAAQLSALIREADYYIDMHTGGILFNIYPLAGYMLHNDETVLQKQRAMAAHFGLPVTWGTDALSEGRTLSVARDAHVPAIYVEYGGGISVSPDIIERYIKGCVNVINYVMDNVPQTKEHIPYEVEDYRVNHGHLQTKMPSPAGGIFCSSIEPGQHIKAGDEWGIIVDPSTNITTQAFADTDGMVLFTRVYPLVRQGESLGGILPADKPGKFVYHAD